MNEFEDEIIAKREKVRELMQYLHIEEYKYDKGIVYLLEKDKMYHTNKNGYQFHYADLDENLYTILIYRLFRRILTEFVLKGGLDRRNTIESRNLCSHVF